MSPDLTDIDITTGPIALAWAVTVLSTQSRAASAPGWSSFANSRTRVKLLRPEFKSQEARQIISESDVTTILFLEVAFELNSSRISPRAPVRSKKLRTASLLVVTKSHNAIVSPDRKL